MLNQIPVLFTLTLTIASTSIQASPITRQGIDKVSNEYLAISRFLRTELYFGRDKPGGGAVTDSEWKDFLDREVTPRFPAGFTVLDGAGQYRDKSGNIVKEPSKVLVFLYSKADRKAAGVKINEIRAAYCKQFQQESVLRLDFKKAVEVTIDE